MSESDPEASEAFDDSFGEPFDDSPTEDDHEAEDRSSELAAAAEQHDPTGLELARQIAAQISAQSPRRRRTPQRPRQRPDLTAGTDADDREPMALGSAFKGLLRHRGWDAQVNVHLLLANWAGLVGQVNADHSAPEKFENKVLTIRAESTTWATQLRLFAPQLVARMNEELGQGTVARVVVKGPDAPSWKHGRRSVRGRGPRDTYG